MPNIRLHTQPVLKLIACSTAYYKTAYTANLEALPCVLQHTNTKSVLRLNITSSIAYYKTAYIASFEACILCSAAYYKTAYKASFEACNVLYSLP